MKLKINVPWMDELLPEGLPVPSSTILSGPGGTGKPLVEFAFVSAWLKAGGTLIAIPLQYSNPKLMKTAMKKLYEVDLDEYQEKIIYIQFEPHAEECKKVNKNTIIANLLKSDEWNKTLAIAKDNLPKSDLGNMVFGSALNLLLFSPTYQKNILEKLVQLTNDRSRTYAFSVSTSAFSEKIKELEKAADNLMFTRMEKPMQLFLKISRMKEVAFSKQEKQVPIPKEMLKEIKKVAESTRDKRIPEISKI